MKRFLITIFGLIGIFSYGDEIQTRDDGFDLVFSQFATAAKTGDFQVMAKFASHQMLDDYYKEPFERIVNKEWRLSRCILHSATRYSFRERRVVFVEAVIEVEEFKKSRFLVMHWVKCRNDWRFLDFPFRDSGFFLTHAFDNYSMSEISFSLLKTAEPAATAQRL